MGARKVLAKNIKRLRDEMSISQEELAYRCGLHRTYLSGVERGIRNPSLDIIEKIAKALNVSVSRLTED
jgi:transcriptional regulator with XRE-family HTH domain